MSTQKPKQQPLPKASPAGQGTAATPAPAPAASLTLQKAAEHSEVVQELLKIYPKLDPATLQVTEDQLQRILHHAQNSSFRMATSTPLVCKTDTCPYKNMCLYYQAGLAQKNEPCMEEVVLIQQTLPSLVQDFTIDLEDRVEHDMVQEYMDAVIQEHRSRKDIALVGQTVERVVAVDETTGQPYTETVENPVLNVKERAQKRKDKIRKDFVKTKEARIKYKITDEGDESTKAAEVRNRVDAAKKNRAARQSHEDVEDADFQDVTDATKQK